MKKEFIIQVNRLAKERIPFFFLVDFEKQNPLIIAANEVNHRELMYDINGHRNFTSFHCSDSPEMTVYALEKHIYTKGFHKVMYHLSKGDSYLLNLTFPTRIEISLPLEVLFHSARAPYRLWLRDQLLCYSPESFIKIKDGKIFTYPMKGTVVFDGENSQEALVQNQKELSEHNTIVDLLRNNLSQIASKVKVNRFRYTQGIYAGVNTLLQVSSEIEGTLSSLWTTHLGELLWNLLPAGSISGAPKNKTIEIIKDAEIRPRGYYTGVFGYFDGKELDSAVAIRFIEQDKKDFFYWSGGGITAYSSLEEEYRELNNKIYVPTV